MHSFFTFIILCITWVVFSGQFDAFHLSLGLISCVWVTLLSRGLVFTKKSHSVPEIVGIIFRMPSYMIWLIYEIFMSNAHVLYLALYPAGIKHVRPDIIEFRTKLKSDYARILLANSITLTPGTVTIKMEDDKLLVHSISVKTTISLEGNMEQRIAHVFAEDIDK